MAKSLCWLLLLGYLHCCFGKETFKLEKGIPVITGLTIQNESDVMKLADYGRYNTVLMKQVDILSLGTDAFFLLENLTQLYIKKGQLGSIYIDGQLIELNINSCKTGAVMIDPQGEYNLEMLYVHHSQLAEVPEHLNSLKNLKELVLNDNAIESVDMANFEGLDRLETIALQRNKIHHFGTTSESPVILPALIALYLDQNQLTVLSFEDWSADALTKIHLNNNQLTKVNELLSPFPALKSVLLHENPLNCSWMNEIVEEMKARNIDYQMKITCGERAEEDDSSEEGGAKYPSIFDVADSDEQIPHAGFAGAAMMAITHIKIRVANMQMENDILSRRLQRQLDLMSEQITQLQAENYQLKNDMAKILESPLLNSRYEVSDK